jgi:hypothetical protein
MTKNHNTTDCRATTKFKEQNKYWFEAKAGSGNNYFPSFSKKSMHSKGSWILKRLQAVRRAPRKAEFLLSNEVNESFWPLVDKFSFKKIILLGISFG